MISLDAAQPLLDQAGLADRALSLKHLRSGGNNDIYRLETDRSVYALKHYKPSPSDMRDRMGAEWDFITAVRDADAGIKVPRAFAMDRTARLGLYELVSGTRPAAENVDAAAISQACRFVISLNDPAVREQCVHLKPASDACFSPKDHLAFVHARIEKVGSFAPDLSPIVQRLDKAVRQIEQYIEKSGLPTAVSLTRAEQCLSPSDFGFHNTLADETGNLTFLDFEYAGWDDPAKLAADFFFQPEIAVSDAFYPHMLAAALSHLQPARRPEHERRAALLRPLFGLRWCCIILNPFDPAWAEKHRAAINGEALEKLRATRLSAADNTLNKTLALIAGAEQAL